MVDIRLTATAASHQRAQRTLSRIEARLRDRLGLAVYGADEDTLEGVVGTLLVSRRKTLGLAESCTGGRLSDWVTNVPGSSRYFRGSVIAYHNEVKRRCFAVPAERLARAGAVSDEVASQMAEGVRRLTGADLGLAITGIAGPTGGTTRKPVGLVYLALADGTRTRTKRCQCFGDRPAIKSQAAHTALDWLRRYLLRQSHH
jgi:nicotinamide-nucleotide amidase